jgi:putative ubiquitin-RnfH superfamily antitoxin RatB of RatAB toxin-antitoxin module
MTEPALLAVSVVHAWPDRYVSVALRLPAGATVGEALTQAAPGLTGIEVDPARLAVFGRAAHLDTPLHEGDRIEILRPLQVDPKEARRARATAQKK